MRARSGQRVSSSTTSSAGPPGDPVLGVVVLDRHGRLVDADEGVRETLARAPELPRALADAIQTQANRPGWSEHTLRVRDRALRIRLLVDPALAEVVAFVAEERRPRALDLSTLSPREREVALLVGGGATDQRIARRLKIAVPTVRWHLTNVYRKSGLHGRADLHATVLQLHRASRAKARGRRLVAVQR